MIPGLLTVSGLSVQEPTEPVLRLFLDPQQIYLDQVFLRTELDWIDWLRQREGADVHLIVTARPSGGGGTCYELRFLGQGAFAGLEDALTLSLPPNSTPDEVRRSLAQRIALGMGRYVARTRQADRVQVKSSGLGASGNTQPTGDPWNAWVFRIDGNGNFSGESHASYSNAWLGLSASRVTAEEFLRVDLSGNWSQSRYELEEGPLTTSAKAFYGNFAGAKGLSAHWTVGLLANGARSTRSNLASSLRLAPALEYSLWPYTESTRRQFTVLYQVGVLRNQYMEETVYGKTRQVLMDNRITAALVLNQSWGTVSTAIWGSAYPQDWGKNSLGLYGGMNVRIAKGVSLNLYLNYSKVRDQLALPRLGATDDEVLLRIKELQTSYRYSATIGLSYTFGSIFNNAVNTRFRSTGAMF